MPVFEITAPDGETYEIEGDNEQGALNALKKALGGASASPGTTPPETPQASVQPPMSDLETLQKESGGFGTLMSRPADLLGGVYEGAKNLGRVINSTGDFIDNKIDEYAPESLAKANRALKDVIPDPVSNEGIDSLPEYQNSGAWGGEVLQGLGEMLPGALLGSAGVARMLPVIAQASNATKVARYGARFLGTETGAAVTADPEQENVIIGTDFPLLRGISVDENGDPDEILLRKKVNQIEDAILLGTLAGGAGKFAGKVGGFAYNSIYKNIKNWRKLDPIQKEFTNTILDIAADIQPGMSQAEVMSRYQKIAQIAQDNTTNKVYFGEPTMKDKELTADTISAIVKGLDPEVDAAVINQLEALRSSAIAESPQLQRTLVRPSEELGNTLDETQEVLGGSKAIDTARDTIQAQGTRDVEAEQLKATQASDELESFKTDTDKLFENDPNFGPELQKARSGNIEFNPRTRTDELENQIRDEAVGELDQIKKESDAKFAAIPDGARVNIPKFKASKKLVEQTFQDEGYGDVLNLLRDAGYNYKALISDVVPRLSYITDELFSQGKNKQAKLVSAFKTHIQDEQLELMAKGSKNKGVRDASKAAKEGFKKEVVPYRQGATQDLTDLNVERRTNKTDDFKVKGREIVRNTLSRNTGVEYVNRLKDLLDRRGKGNLIGDWQMGNLAASAKEMVQESGMVDVKALRKEAQSYRSTMPKEYADRMEKMLNGWDTRNKNVDQLVKELEVIQKKADSAQDTIYGERLQEFFTKGRSGNWKTQPNGFKSFEDLMNNPQNGDRISEILKASEGDETLRDGMKVAWSKMAQDKYFSSKEITEIPESFIQFGKQIYGDAPVEGIEQLAQLAREGKAANKVRANTGLDTNFNQGAMARAVNLVSTWVFGVLNPTAARIRTVTSDVLKRYDSRDISRQASDNILSNAQLFSDLAQEIIDKGQTRLTPDQKAFIYRVFVPSVLKGTGEDEQTEALFNE